MDDFSSWVEKLMPPALCELHAKRYTGKEDRFQSLKEHTKAVVNEAVRLLDYGLIRDSHLALQLVIACLYHDFGKVNAQFRHRISSEKKIYFDKLHELPHNYLSLYFVQKEIDGFYTLDEDSWYRVMYAVSHHHYLDNDLGRDLNHNDSLKTVLTAFKEEFDGTLEKKLRRKHLKRVLGNVVEDTTESKSELHAREFLTGLLMLCDHAASAGYPVMYKSDSLYKAVQNIVNIWKGQFGADADWNDLQKYCLAHQNDNILITGETGLGKTEGALLWIGQDKGFFFLPLRTAINSIYSRIVEYLKIYQKDRSVNGITPIIEEAVSLLHSDNFAYLMETWDKEDAATGGIQLSEYLNRAKKFSLPLIISTVDQLFDFVFRLKGYERKFAALSISKLVIDEIQMYDPALLAYLLYGLDLAVEQGAKVAVLTATLPPFIRDLLLRHIKFVDVETETIESPDGRSIKHATGNKQFMKDQPPRHSLCIKEEEMTTEDILNLYRDNEAQGKSNKILVICNTVSAAQIMYNQLRQVLGKVVHTFHSRFTGIDRAKKEKAILDFGRTYSSNDDGQQQLHKGTGIWVTTSICEASLDIDFDYLFTEMTYLTGLQQRMGRCNRKGKKSIEKTNCFIYTEINESYFKSRGHRPAFMDKVLYDASVEALLHFQAQKSGSQNIEKGIPITEREKIALIEEAFSMERVKNSDFMRVFNETDTYIREKEIYGSSSAEGQLEAERKSTLRDIRTTPVIPKVLVEQHTQETDIYNELKEQADILRDTSQTYEAREKAKVFIQSHTVPLMGYRGTSTKTGEIVITESWKIPITNLYYDEHVGLVYDEIKDQLSGIEEEHGNGAFI